IGAEEHPLHAFDGEQPLGERGGLGRIGGGKIHRALVHDHAAREELQGRRIGRLLGLDEQNLGLLRRGPWLGRPGTAQSWGLGRLRPRWPPSDLGTDGGGIKRLLGPIGIIVMVNLIIKPPNQAAWQWPEGPRSNPLCATQRWVPGNPLPKRRREFLHTL